MSKLMQEGKGEHLVYGFLLFALEIPKKRLKYAQMKLIFDAAYKIRWIWTLFGNIWPKFQYWQ